MFIETGEDLFKLREPMSDSLGKQGFTTDTGYRSKKHRHVKMFARNPMREC